MTQRTYSTSTLRDSRRTPCEGACPLASTHVATATVSSPYRCRERRCNHPVCGDGANSAIDGAKTEGDCGREGEGEGEAGREEGEALLDERVGETLRRSAWSVSASLSSK